MSTLQERLEEVMRDQRWDHGQLMRITGASSSLVSQWLGKGSKPIERITKVTAAVRIERASGWSAAWVADGEGPKKAPGHPIAGEPPAAYRTARDLVEELASVLAGVPNERRQAMADVLAGLAREGGAPHWVQLAVTLLTDPAKRVAAA